jgi:hypothetical protein
VLDILPVLVVLAKSDLIRPSSARRKVKNSRGTHKDAPRHQALTRMTQDDSRGAERCATRMRRGCQRGHEPGSRPRMQNGRRCCLTAQSPSSSSTAESVSSSPTRGARAGVADRRCQRLLSAWPWVSLRPRTGGGVGATAGCVTGDGGPCGHSTGGAAPGCGGGS